MYHGTWLTPNDRIAAAGITPHGYKLLSCPRLDGPGGGIELICRFNISTESLKFLPATTFEVKGLRINNGDRYIMSLFIIYRPPPSPKNGFTIAKFLEEFERCIDGIALTSKDIVLLGEFNIHIDNTS